MDADHDTDPRRPIQAVAPGFVHRAGPALEQRGDPGRTKDRVTCTHSVLRPDPMLALEMRKRWEESSFPADDRYFLRLYDDLVSGSRTINKMHAFMYNMFPKRRCVTLPPSVPHSVSFFCFQVQAGEAGSERGQYGGDCGRTGRLTGSRRSISDFRNLYTNDVHRDRRTVYECSPLVYQSLGFSMQRMDILPCIYVWTQCVWFF